MKFAVLPYFVMIWAFTEHVGTVATPWTIGWILLWLIYAPIATWSGVHVFAGAHRLTIACFAALIAAVPFWPDAIWMLTTILVSGFLGALFQLWIAIAVFVAIVAGIWIWYHGGIGL